MDQGEGGDEDENVEDEVKGAQAVDHEGARDDRGTQRCVQEVRSLGIGLAKGGDPNRCQVSKDHEHDGNHKGNAATSRPEARDEALHDLAHWAIVTPPVNHFHH
jgi:hypothetical protein